MIRSSIFGGALGAAVILASAVVERAQAGPPPTLVLPSFTAGTFDVDYTRLSPNLGHDADQWGANGAGLVKFTPSLGLQLNGGYNRISSTGPNSDTWNVGGTGIWSWQGFQLGPALSYQSNKVAGFTTGTVNYGGFADYRPFSAWNNAPFGGSLVQIHGGGISGSFGLGGSYVGGGFNLYPCPDFLVNGNIDYTRTTRAGFTTTETDYTVGGEYLLPVPVAPLSLYGNYTRSNFGPNTNFHVDSFSVGVRLYFNGDGPATLAQRQETGVLPFSPITSAIGLRF